MRVYKKKKMDTHYRYPSYIQLWKLLEEVREDVEVEERVTGYYYDKLELSHRPEFDQLKEFDEEGNVISEDYIESNYENLLEEARVLDEQKNKDSKKNEVSRYRDFIREGFRVEWNGYKQRIRKEDTSDLDSKLTEAEKIKTPVAWVFSSGEVVMLSPERLLSLGKDIGDRIDELYLKEYLLKNKISQLATTEDVLSFDIEKEWNELVIE